MALNNQQRRELTSHLRAQAEREMVGAALRRDESRTVVQKYGTPEQRGCSEAEGRYEAYLVWSAITQAHERHQERTKVPVQ